MGKLNRSPSSTFAYDGWTSNTGEVFIGTMAIIGAGDKRLSYPPLTVPPHVRNDFLRLSDGPKRF